MTMCHYILSKLITIFPVSYDFSPAKAPKIILCLITARSGYVSMLLILQKNLLIIGRTYSFTAFY